MIRIGARLFTPVYLQTDAGPQAWPTDTARGIARNVSTFNGDVAALMGLIGKGEFAQSGPMTPPCSSRRMTA